MTDTTKAFALSETCAVIAVHRKPSNSTPPRIWIALAGSGTPVTGVDELKALREAIDFALNGDLK